MQFVGVKDNGEAVTYIDRKRLGWLNVFIVPAVGLVPLTIFGFIDHNPLWLLLPTLIVFGLLPLLDALVGNDSHNPPEEVVPAMAKDRYYDYVLYATVPAYFAALVMEMWVLATFDIPWWAVIALLWGMGIVLGNTTTIGHELGHRTDKLNRFWAKMALSVSGYGHFTGEHNRHHHTWVSTPEDPASAKLGESVYRFACRELPGALIGGLKQEKRRLAAKGLPFFHWRNDVLQVYAVTILVGALLIAWLGWIVLPFLIIQHFLSWYALTQVNYLEHYGLLREKRENGRYEPCQPWHSWNSNHLVSNVILNHLQRHSDHHAHPARPYQALRDFDNVPSLPTGYPGALFLVAFPPLWFRIMDPKVMAWAGNDPRKVHLSEARARAYGVEAPQRVLT
ncbi:alkane-1 monooxygenase [Parvularcula bermudensis HTCC2503]|uniref:Alkane-1 monooxygenase n=1 Tax=Parvularcula bermudensis (strain ATCC BAA-594 / HTCC2503 / KCTC 12087) TaxID=314260 RepID=E0TD71_PARBH|nr:alkane 1-monooxygenase [Parvularcula bermudensis]ADM09894.1 alkane-1 monooxygenase [Parvularcula bermudensis HTCC2503]